MKLIIVALVALVSSASAAPSHHRAHPSRALPGGVPEGYVFTHSGFFHPSCVYTLADDEVWSPGFIKGRDGSVRERVAACPYPHFSNDGRVLAGRPRAHGGPGSGADLSGPFGDYDGWLLYFWAGVETGASIPVGASIDSTWVVPSVPTHIGFQDIAFFNSLELDLQHNDVIVQPVLDFSEVPNHWAIESETCCFDGNDMQSTLVTVSPGDTIRGTVVPQGCNSTTGVCTTMAITTTDLTTGGTTTLSATAHGLVVNDVDAAVLETYSVDTCDMLPASGEVVFDGTLLTSTGDAVPLTYSGGNCVTATCDVANGSLTNVPTTCNWGIAQSADTFTLTFNASPFIVDGGSPSFGLDLGMPDAAVPHDLAVAVSTPDDMTTVPKSKKHGCDMAPLGSASSHASWIVLALLALSCARGARTRRGATQSTRCRS